MKKGTMIAFASGLSMGLMYTKYQKEINKYIKSMMKKVNI